MLSELQSLAALASSLPDITLEVGEPGCPWSFNWVTRRITADPADLTLRLPDYCRGLILHEAAHGAITRIGGIVPERLLSDEIGLHQLLNAVEDCRIENWLQLRFPGCRPWVRLYNDRLLSAHGPSARGAELVRDPAKGFLMGMLDQWWNGEATHRIHPLAVDALYEIKPYFDEAVAAFPHPLPPDAAKVIPLYDRHPVAACFQAHDKAGCLTAEERVIRMTQHRMWTLSWNHIYPVFRRLLEHPDSEETRHWMAAQGASADQPHHAGVPIPGKANTDVPPPKSASDQAYANAVERDGALIESCAEVILRLLMNESRPKISRFHRSGNQLDLRMAMQFEADPRLADRLFQRRTLAKHPDPAFIVLADESSSMRGPSSKATFESVVVLREVCLRLGIPLAILGFGSETRCIQDWDGKDSSQMRGKVCGLKVPKAARTLLEPALESARELANRLPGMRKTHVWILSDGAVSNVESVRLGISGFRRAGIPVYGLGLGPDSHAISQILPHAVVGIQPSDLPRVFAEMLQTQVLCS